MRASVAANAFHEACMNDAFEQANAVGADVGQISDATDELSLPQKPGGGYRPFVGNGGPSSGRLFRLRSSSQSRRRCLGEGALSLASPGDSLVIDAGNEPKSCDLG